MPSNNPYRLLAYTNHSAVARAVAVAFAAGCVLGYAAHIVVGVLLR